MSRKENIKWLIKSIRKAGLESNNHKVPFLVVIEIAMRLGVSRETAISYAEQIRKIRIFADDGYCFIIDPEKEIILPKTESENTLDRMDKKLDKILKILESRQKKLGTTTPETNTLRELGTTTPSESQNENW